MKRKLTIESYLQAILEKNIDLYDYETIVDTENRRLIGLGDTRESLAHTTLFELWDKI
jgi:hypothetical protein